MSKIANPMKVITGPDTRWSYANVWEPKSINGGAPKYSVSLIIPKSDNKTLAKIKSAIEAAYKEGEAKLKGNGKSVPALSAIKTPLRDGDTERPDDPAYANAFFINANASSAGQWMWIAPDSDPLRSVLRCVRSRQHHLLRLQQLRQSRHRLRPEQPAEGARRRAPGRQGQRGG
jgi:hypothetical protein